jgi:lipopolysaccharide biosynthesis regulator YciM
VVVAPIHHTDSPANRKMGTACARQNGSAIAETGMNGATNLIASMAASATSVRANMAESAVLRAAGGTNSAVTAASNASQATRAFNP